MAYSKLCPRAHAMGFKKCIHLFHQFCRKVWLGSLEQLGQSRQMELWREIFKCWILGLQGFKPLGHFQVRCSQVRICGLSLGSTRIRTNCELPIQMFAGLTLWFEFWVCGFLQLVLNLGSARIRMSDVRRYQSWFWILGPQVFEPILNFQVRCYT